MEKEMRLIDANKLESKLQEHHDFFVDGVGGFRFLSPKDKARVDEITNCIAEVCNAPTVDAVEVKHGRWQNWHYDPCEDCYVHVCSKCGGTNERMKPYCPNCGAKMDGGNEYV